MANIESVRLPDNSEYNIKDATAQTKTLATPITIEGPQETTVEGALTALNRAVENITNPNLLLNPWFTVNQRSFSSGSAAAYTVDRWKKADSTGTLTLTSSGLQFPASTACEVQQIFETIPWDGKVVTISLMYSDRTIVSGTDTWTTGGDAKTFIDDGKMIVELNASGNFVLKHNTSDANIRTVRAVKLERGYDHTLHLDVAPEYETELLKCQRYYVRIDYPQYAYICIIAIVSNHEGVGVIPLATPMRAMPTLSWTGSFNIYMGGGTTKAVYAIVLHGMQRNSFGAVFSDGTTVAGLTPGESAFINAPSTGAYIELDAEL